MKDIMLDIKYVNTMLLSVLGLSSVGRLYIRDFPHMMLYSGLAIMLTILALNFLGDGLRDALDPKLKR